MAFIRVFSLEILLINRFFENQDRTTLALCRQSQSQESFRGCANFRSRDGRTSIAGAGELP